MLGYINIEYRNLTIIEREINQQKEEKERKTNCQWGKKTLMEGFMCTFLDKDKVDLTF